MDLRHKLSFAWLLILVAACGNAVDEERASAVVPQQAATAIQQASVTAPFQQTADLGSAPSWELVDQNGRKVAFDGQFDRPTVLLFWATWCPYCKQLMPHLQSIKDQYGADVDILALNVFEDDDPVAFMDEFGYQFRLIPNADSIAPLYNVKGTPGLFLVDAQGRVHYDLYQLQVTKPIPEDIKRWQKAARLAPMWAAELRRVLAKL